MAIIVGGRPCVLGFDRSAWQAPGPLHTAAAAGHRFAVIKATEGDSYRDARYGQHVATVIDAGLLPGSYHFARPDWSDGGAYWDGRQEADLFLSVIDDRIVYVVLDLESTAVDAVATTEYVLGFWDRIIETARWPLREQRVTYVGKWFTYQHAATIRDRSCLWVPSYTAGYQRDPDPTRIDLPAWSSDLWPEGWFVWQYTSSGTVAGVHPHDVNVATETWFDAVATGRPGDHGFIPRQEDDMPRPIYRFPAGFDHPNAGYEVIDWRDGAYPLPDGTGVGYGPHWYHTGRKDNAADQREVYQLIANGQINVATVTWLASGNDGLDDAYGDQPHVLAGVPAFTPGAAGPAAGGAVDVDELVPALAGPVATEIAQRAGGGGA